MVLLAEFQVASLAFAMALGVAIWILLKRARRYRSPQSCRPIAKVDRPQPFAEDSDKRPPGELSRWEVQMYDTARDLTAELDTKMGMLQQLIRDADRAAARLERALEANDAERPSDRSPDLSADNQARGLTSAADAAESQPAPMPKERYEEIYTLADYGFPPAEIAHRLGTPIGEVELILSLRDKGR